MPKRKEDITVNTCPKCKDVWLDRDEHDKIIELTEVQYADVTDFKGRGRSESKDEVFSCDDKQNWQIP